MQLILSLVKLVVQKVLNLHDLVTGREKEEFQIFRFLYDSLLMNFTKQALRLQLIKHFGNIQCVFHHMFAQTPHFRDYILVVSIRFWLRIRAKPLRG